MMSARTTFGVLAIVLLCSAGTNVAVANEWEQLTHTQADDGVDHERESRSEPLLHAVR